MEITGSIGSTRPMKKVSADRPSKVMATVSSQDAMPMMGRSARGTDVVKRNTLSFSPAGRRWRVAPDEGCAVVDRTPEWRFAPPPWRGAVKPLLLGHTAIAVVREGDAEHDTLDVGAHGNLAAVLEHVNERRRIGMDALDGVIHFLAPLGVVLLHGRQHVARQRAR